MTKRLVVDDSEDLREFVNVFTMIYDDEDPYILAGTFMDEDYVQYYFVRKLFAEIMYYDEDLSS